MTEKNFISTLKFSTSAIFSSQFFRLGKITAEGSSSLDLREVFAHAKVSELHMSLRVKHHIIEFQISVDNVSRVQKEEGESEFGAIEDDQRFAELAILLNAKHQVSAVHVLHYKVQSIGCLKARMQLH